MFQRYTKCMQTMILLLLLTVVHHFVEDFTKPIRNLSIKTLQTVNNDISVKGEGIVEWIARDINGQKIIIRIKALYVPDAHIRLFFPQIWLDTAGVGSEYVMRKHISCLIDENKSELVIPYHPNNNLPTMFISNNEQPSTNIKHSIMKPLKYDIFIHGRRN